MADLDRRLGSQPPPAVFSPELGPLVKDAEIPSGFNLFMRAETEEDRAETVRLFYVAATRAADYLILSAGIENPENEKKDEKEKTEDPKFEARGEWMQLLARHFDLFSGEPHQEREARQRSSRRSPSSQAPPDRSDDPPPIENHRRKDSQNGGKRGRLVAAVFGPGSRRGIGPPADVVLPIVGQAASTTCLPSPFGGHHEVVGAGGEGCWRFPDSGPRIDPLGLGTLVHAVLAEVDFAQPKNLAALIERHAAEHVGDDRAAIAQATEMLERFLNSDRAKEIAAAKQVYRELEFLLAWPPEGDRARRTIFPRFHRLALSRRRRRLAYPRFQNQRCHGGEYRRSGRELRNANAGLCLGGRKDIKMPPAGMVLHFLRTGWEKAFPWDDAARKRLVEMVQAVL